MQASSRWLVLVVTLVTPWMAFAAGPLVKIDTGIVEGKNVGTVHAFLGIPYAAPPLGKLRWKPPAPPTNWTSVRRAVSFGARCMQTRVYSDMVFRDPGISEDCLMLNVWTHVGGKTALPVMVWIHGGGFAAGASSEPRQDGARLAKIGVVVVSMNYRMGIFGFFVHPELTAESGKSASGNYGLLDIVAALQWVQRNIAAFGGDPGNVTIFGESAGSFAVSALMASPLANGLFHKAIGESGAAFHSTGLSFRSRAEREPVDSKFMSSVMGIQTLAQLRTVPAKKLLDAASKKTEGHDDFSFGPDTDGYFLPESVPAIFAAGQQNDVPLVAGWNRDEGSFEVAKTKPTVASLKERAGKEFDDHSAEFLRLYPADNDQQAYRALEDFEGDRFIAFSTWKWMEMQKATGKQTVYRYRFDLALPPDPKEPGPAVANHSGEIEYVFGMLDSKARPWRPEDRKLSEQMQKYWTNFARTGDPNGADLPKWPVYESTSSCETMYLSATPEARKDDMRERYLFLDRMWGK
jgi:para-nitrobenzyl esterase